MDTNSPVQPIRIHIFFLVALAVPGLAVLAVEALSDRSGGWVIERFTLAKLYWLAFFGFSVFSSLVVWGVRVFHRAKKIPFRKRAVI
jgi:hypothetical protein